MTKRVIATGFLDLERATVVVEADGERYRTVTHSWEPTPAERADTLDLAFRVIDRQAMDAVHEARAARRA